MIETFKEFKENKNKKNEKFGNKNNDIFTINYGMVCEISMKRILSKLRINSNILSQYDFSLFLE